jgi:carbonic anhydrase
VHGFQRFYAQRQHDDKRLFEYISKKQDPHTLFIACSDSRIIPALITSADPGELFIMRNIGNYIPPYIPGVYNSEAAAIEFALSSFDITDIVVCGHANCGAMAACQKLNPESSLSSANEWIGKIKSQLIINDKTTVNQLAQENVINQINNLKLYPIVQDKMANQTLMLHGWFYDFQQSAVSELDQQEMQFQSIVPEKMVNDNPSKIVVAHEHA